MQAVQEIIRNQYQKSQRIVAGMTIDDAVKKGLNHFTIDEARMLYKNTMRNYANNN